MKYWYVFLLPHFHLLSQENSTFTSPDYYKDITLDSARKIFRSATSTEIPLLEKRVEHLREAGRILSTRYSSSAANLVKSCSNSAARLVKALVSQFVSFKDEAVFQNQLVSFYKRAQIFVADVWACFEGQALGRFDDIHELTMFADYRVPQCLQFLGVLAYDDALKQKIEKEEEIPVGSAEEVEIRGCSIHAIECLREAIKNRVENDSQSHHLDKANVNSVVIDFYLWDFATLNYDQMEKFPEHHTRTNFY